MDNELYLQATAVMEELGRMARLKRGDLAAVGCSTSATIGSQIGTNSSPETV